MTQIPRDYKDITLVILHFALWPSVEWMIAESFLHQWRYGSSPNDTIWRGMDISEQPQIPADILDRSFSCISHLRGG